MEVYKQEEHEEEDTVLVGVEPEEEAFSILPVLERKMQYKALSVASKTREDTWRHKFFSGCLENCMSKNVDETVRLLFKKEMSG